MPTIDVSDDELAALAAAIRNLITQDRFPHDSGKTAHLLTLNTVAAGDRKLKRAIRA
jgi:hypothetical protein